ncbi:MAG: PEP-CTERM sorting domain-containing protein [Acetobacteraceae bacterium]
MMNDPAGTGRQPKAGFTRWLGRIAGAAAVLSGIGVSNAHADAVLLWNNEMLSVTRQTSALMVAGPPEVAREIAIIGTAMSDAVNAASGSPYASYAYTGGPVSGASAEAAALSAGYQAMYSIFSNPVWTGTGGDANLINNTILPQINATYNSALAALGSSAAVTSGVNLGIAAANAIIANRANDGAIPAIIDGLTPYVPPGSGTVPGVYVPPSATGGRPAMFPTWGTVTPFGVTSTQGQAIKSATAINLPSLDSAGYAAALLRTECLGSAPGTTLSPATQSACSAAGYTPRTTEQLNAALFWNDPGGTLQPPGHWLEIASTLMQSQNLDLLQQARLTSLLGMALTDAGIYAWDVKYDVNLWRPNTAYAACATDTAGGTVDWNPYFTTCDTSWTSAIATPPHPDYVAGHPAFSGAAATVLEGFFGVDGLSFCSTSDPYVNGSLGSVDAITMCFDSISSASNGPLGSTLSRIYGGIHTSYAVDDAEALGNAIGQQILTNLEISPIPEPVTLAILGVGAAAVAGLRQRRRRHA